MPASVHIVSWQGSVARRIVVVPPAWMLVALFLGACAVAVAIAGRRAWSVDRADPLTSLRWLWLLAMPYVPWIPGYLPQLLVFDGPLGWVLCAAVAIALAVQWLGPRWTPVVTERPSRWVLLVMFTVGYAAVGWHATRSIGPGGDEPHYLVISQSLLADGDIRIENQHTERQYKTFFRGDIRPHFLQRGLGEVIYSIHAPGLPVLALPAYALGGYRGVLLWLAIVATVGAVAMFDLAYRIGGIRVAWLTAIALACAMPFAPHAWLFFPELPAATIVALAVGWLWDDARDRSPGVWLVRGAVLAPLPWLHTKFVVLLAGLVLGLVCRAWPRRRDIVLVAAAPFLSGVLWLYSFYVMYGVPNPTIAYGVASSTVDLDWANVPRGMLGWIFDQEFGLLLYAPALLMAPLGVAYLVRRREWRLPAAVAALTAVAFAVGVARVYMWWGGWSAPGRFLVPVVPLLCPFFAGLAAAWADTWRGRALSVAAAWGLLALVWTVADPDSYLMFNTRDGTGRWLSAIEGSSSLNATWPTYFAIDWPAQWPRTAALSAAMVLAWVVLAALEWRRPSTSLASALPRTLGIGLVSLGAVSGLAITQDDRPRIATTGGMNLLDRRVNSRLAAVDPDTFRLVPAAAVLDAVALRLPAAPPESRYGRIAGPFHLPAGRYRLRAWGSGQQAGLPDTATLRLEYHTNDGFVVRARGPQSNPVSVDFDLPVALGDLWVTLRAGRSTRFRAVELLPLALDPPPEIPVGTPYSIWPVDGAAGAFVISLDDGYYSEGSGGWVRGERQAALLIAGGQPSRVRVRLANGPIAQTVTVQVGDREQQVSLASNGESAVEADLPRGGAPLRIVVTSPSGFRPHDYDPAANDRRWLGCRIAIDAS